MLPIARWQQRCTGWMEPSKQVLKSGILACTLLTSPAFALSVDDAKHLALRTSFAASPSLMNALLPLTREEAVDYVLNQVSLEPMEPPSFISNLKPRPVMSKLSESEIKEYREQRKQDNKELRFWYIENLLAHTPPISAQMQLFWNNHFTSSLSKPDDAVIAWRKSKVIENQSLGRFDLMLKLLMQDPAILIYLDNNKNNKNSPNENLARELLELYTVGEGNYSENDIKEVARSLTGWSVDIQNRSFTINTKAHDVGEKNVLGKKGNFTMVEVLNILLERPETSELVVKKVWKQFVSSEINKKEVEGIARNFRVNNYEIKSMLRQVLLTDDFWSDKNRAVLVKSPLELLLGLYLQQGLQKVDYRQFNIASNRMGQKVFSPPNVKGWPIASSEWINSETLLKRKNAINRLMRAKESDPNIKDERAVLNEAMEQWANSEAFNYQKDWLLAAPPVGDVDSEDPMETLKNLLNDPVYQLK